MGNFGFAGAIPAEVVKAQPNGRKPAVKPAPKPDMPEAPRSFRDFLQCVKLAKKPGGEAYRRRLEKVYGTEYQTISTVSKAAMDVESGAIGGYIVPLDYTEKLMGVVSENSIIYPRADVLPMGATQMNCPKIDVETVPASAGIAPFFGGLQFKWGFSQSPTETENTFRMMQLNAWDLLGYAVASNQFLEDIGPTGDQWLLNLFGKAAAWYAEYAFFQGTGSSQQMPLGIIKSPALKTVTRSGTGAIAISDIAGMAAALLPYSWTHAIWACSPTALNKVMAINQFYINVEANVEGGQAGSLLTRPVFVTEKLPANATPAPVGDIILFDPSLYIIGDRQQVLIDVSEHVSFTTYQTNFRIWLRLDGMPMLSNTVTLQDKSTVVSAYVALSAS